MKKLLLSLTIIAAAFGASAQTKTISGHITGTRNLSNDTIYRLDGFVYVDSLATLNIEQGTIIRGIKDSKGSLIVTRGGKINANGTKENPVVFTSDQAAGSRATGDWGGIIILGSAPINVAGGQGVIEGGVNNANGDGQYGGVDVADNSGILKYVRIEYPGIAFSANNEINGLTMGGVGSATTIENVQVSFSGDDSFEWFGGTVNGKYLIANKGLDDDFDTDFGFQGKIQFGVIVRDSLVADAAGDSNGFESDNDATGSNNGPKTAPVFSNITVVGPLKSSNTQISAFFKRALRLRRNTETSTFNSVFMGFPTGLFIEDDKAVANAKAGLLEFKNSVIVACPEPLKKKVTNETFDMDAWYAAGLNTTLATNDDAMLNDAFNYNNPNIAPKVGSPLLLDASFTTSAKISDPFFTPVTFRGAMGADDWTSGWANFNPQVINYDLAIPSADFTFDTTNKFVVSFTNTTTNTPSSTVWNFGDGSTSTDMNPSHTYAANGTYEVSLVARNANGVDSVKKSVVLNVVVVSGLNNPEAVQNLIVYPNPVNNVSTVAFTSAKASTLSIAVYDVTGKMVAKLADNMIVSTGTNTVSFDASDLTSGIYIVKFTSADAVSTRKVQVVK